MSFPHEYLSKRTKPKKANDLIIALHLSTVLPYCILVYIASNMPKDIHQCFRIPSYEHPYGRFSSWNHLLAAAFFMFVHTFIMTMVTITTLSTTVITTTSPSIAFAFSPPLFVKQQNSISPNHFHPSFLPHSSSPFTQSFSKTPYKLHQKQQQYSHFQMTSSN